MDGLVKRPGSRAPRATTSPSSLRFVPPPRVSVALDAQMLGNALEAFLLMRQPPKKPDETHDSGQDESGAEEAVVEICKPEIS